MSADPSRAPFLDLGLGTLKPREAASSPLARIKIPADGFNSYRSGTNWKIGCCGFPVAKAKYQEVFPVVEIQQTFYQLPKLETAQRWREESPKGFEFTLKAWQLITHEPTSPTYRRLTEKIPQRKRLRYGSFRLTDEVWEAWERTLRMAQALQATVILFQCPASFTATWEHQKNVRAFFKKIRYQRPLPPGLRLAWEPRGSSWASKVVKAICQDLDLVHCVDPFLQEPLTSGFYYLRIHGGKGYAHAYSQEELAGLRERLRALRGPGISLFNNIRMWDDARHLQTLMAC